MQLNIIIHVMQPYIFYKLDKTSIFGSESQHAKEGKGYVYVHVFRNSKHFMLLPLIFQTPSTKDYMATFWEKCPIYSESRFKCRWFFQKMFCVFITKPMNASKYFEEWP